MGTIVLDAALRARLNGLNEKLEVRDENGQLVGHFVPVARPQNLEIPLPPEEIERRTRQVSGRGLQGIWKDLGAK